MKRFSYRKYAESLYEALLEDPFYIALEESVQDDPQKAKECMLKYYQHSMIEAEKYGELLVPKDDNKYGVSIWSIPLPNELSNKKSDEKTNFLLKEMGKASSEIYKSITEFMADKAASIIGNDFWYLSIIGIHPKYQGKGLGKNLLMPILEKTDGLGVSTYLETFTPRNKKFYTRFGFEDAATFSEPTTNSNYSIMIREAKHNL